MKNLQYVLVVGAGFAGSVVARELAESGFRVRVIDRRSHIGGNAFDSYDANGVLIHNYGPHIFHTNSVRILRWLSKFTEWRHYEHRVLAKIDNQLLPIPINRTTINRLYGLNLDEKGIEGFFDSCRVRRDKIETSEDVVLSGVGRDLCEKFYRGYTRKQWGLDLSELSANVASRIPVRINDDDRYFTDTFQFMPSRGYTEMFHRILSHERITIELGIDFADIRRIEKPTKTIYTGPIDAFYDYRFGKLPYRSIFFEHEHVVGVDRQQEVGTINYPNDYAYTRITEFKHITGQTFDGSSLVKEFPQAEGDPYYPIPNPDNEALFKKYKALAAMENDVYFLGRLAQYKYYNMDQVVASALKLASEIIESTSIIA